MLRKIKIGELVHCYQGREPAFTGIVADVDEYSGAVRLTGKIPLCSRGTWFSRRQVVPLKRRRRIWVLTKVGIPPAQLEVSLEPVSGWAEFIEVPSHRRIVE